eukprot:11194480-Lingulodinium_polyedra.AAC.1
MPHVGDVEPAYPLVVEPVSKHGAVEFGWPGHLAVLFPEVSTQAQKGILMLPPFILPALGRQSSN